MCLFPAGEYIATGSLGGNVSIWSLSKGDCLREVQGSGDTFDVSWSADGSLLCSCFSSGMLCVIDTTNSLPRETLSTSSSAVASGAGGMSAAVEEVQVVEVAAEDGTELSSSE